MFRKILEFFISIRTTIWTSWILIGLLFAGAFIMPTRAEFQTIHSSPLLYWLTEQPLNVTWWLWGAIGILILLTINTIFCSIWSIIKKRKATHWLLLISPQIIHIGFLFILLAHLFSSIGGFKGFTGAMEGTSLKMPDNTVLSVTNISISIDRIGYIIDWAVDVDYRKDGEVIQKDRLLPNKPSFRGGTGVYVKDVRAYPFEAVLLEISSEPGAPWALIGGIVFTIGTIILVVLRIRQSQSTEQIK